MKKKLIFVIPTLTHGGAERVCAELASELGRVHAVQIIIFGGTTEQKLASQVQLIKMDGSRKSGDSFVSAVETIRGLRDHLALVEPDLVISFMERANVYCALATFSSGIRLVPTIHATVDSLADRPIFHRLVTTCCYRLLLNHVVGVATVSSRIAQSLKERYSLENIHVLPNGVDIAQYNTSSRSRGTVLELLVVSRLHPEKQICISILAVRNLKNIGVEAALTIVGAGAERQVLEELVDRVGLRDHVRFTGAQDAPFNGRYKADCLLLTSKRESFGLVMIEAILSGIPVIALDCPTGPREICRALNGRGIRLLPMAVENTEETSVRLGALIHRELVLSNLLASEVPTAAEAVRRTYSIDLSANKLLEIGFSCDRQPL